MVDTVGAGDHFTAGFLHAALSGGSLQACAACGCAAGTAAVQVAGAALCGEALAALQHRITELLEQDRSSNEAGGPVAVGSSQ